MATTTVNAIKVGNTSVDKVIVNGVTVFGTTTTTTTYNLGKIYVKYNAYDGSSRYFKVKMDSISSGATINVVVATGTSYNSTTYTLSGNLKFAYGSLTSAFPSTELKVASNNSYCMIGLKILSGRTTNTPNPLIGGTIGNRGTGKWYAMSGNYSLMMTNIPYGDGTIMGENTDVYLLYGGNYSGISTEKQVYPATTWKTATTVNIRNLKVTT